LKASEFQNVFSHPFKASDACLMVLGKKNTLEHPRLGLAIAKKKVKRAVDRNRIKRIIRNTFRLQPDLGCFDFVVIANAGLAKRDNQAIEQSLIAQCQKIQKKCEKFSSPS
jgi:ribonuclease P protein component